ncbi:MAG: nucleotidyltransferase family protein [Arenicellales bacterium]|nr:nucleotidyltransferase family protein [Arenicellales bacterium]
MPDGPVTQGCSDSVAAMILAAGFSRRMGQQNKLLLPIGDIPMIRHVALAVLASRAEPVIAVTGFEGKQVRHALAELKLTIAENPCPDEGLSSSLRIGLEALPRDCGAVLVCLGDMPGIRARHIDALVTAFLAHDAKLICTPTYGGERGNPVLWPRHMFTKMQALVGDTGARALLARYRERVLTVPMTDSAVVTDIDTPDCLGRFDTTDGLGL